MKVKSIIYVFFLFLLVLGLNVSAGGMEVLSTLRKNAKELSANHEKEISDAMSVREEKIKTPGENVTSEVKILSRGKKMRIERLIRIMDQDDQDGDAEGIMNIILFDVKRHGNSHLCSGRIKEKGRFQIKNGVVRKVGRPLIFHFFFIGDKLIVFLYRHLFASSACIGNSRGPLFKSPRKLGYTHPQLPNRPVT